MTIKEATDILELALSKAGDEKNYSFYTAINTLLKELKNNNLINKTQIEELSAEIDEHYFYHTFI